VKIPEGGTLALRRGEEAKRRRGEEAQDPDQKEVKIEENLRGWQSSLVPFWESAKLWAEKLRIKQLWNQDSPGSGQHLSISGISHI
jgi:hypothetical protein